METKQTAVEYLVKEFSAILGPIKTEAMQDLLLVDAIEKAKAMEKNQIEKAFEHSMVAMVVGKVLSPEQYYNETYNNQDNG